MKKALFLFLFLSPLLVQAQVQSQSSCIATVRARAGMSLTESDAQKLCSENSMAVINCALTQMQGARLTGTLQSSLKQCQLEWTATSMNGQGVF